ncbi:MAG TPA: M48 family metalloprotease [Thermoanaerobaculia bacterium]|nr:M48 family metalloprotease [Thermoanaerobaculia bacterium]
MRTNQSTSSSPRARGTALVLTAVLAFTTAAPALPQPAPGIDDADLFEKSARAAAEALEVYGAWDDPVETERVQRIGYAIARHSGFEKYPFSFFIVDMAIPNAFALPAGHIFVTRGMLDLGLDDDMLAGLLGHEVAHVTREHFLKMRRRATLLTVLSQVLTVGVLVGASQRDDDTYVDGWGVRRSSGAGASLVEGAAATGMLVTELLMRSYSRENEDESDEEGQRYAAAAGFDPEGTRRLMARMEERLPQDQSFGYWQTHPFFEERVRAAKARQTIFKVQEPQPIDEYRRRTQQALLGFADGKTSPGVRSLIKDSALAAWPSGPDAEGLRLEKLRASREAELARRPLARDYGALLASYAKARAVVRELTPESPFLATLDQEMRDLAAQRDRLYPEAVAVLDGTVYETPFLEIFLSNFPDSDRAPQVALSLGESYARLGRETEAVENLLTAWRAGSGAESSERARRGLTVLAPRLDRLAALKTLADQEEDAELREMAAARLAKQVSTFKELENGAEFLERFPESELWSEVHDRQNALADELYKEVILYQRVGDHAKAVQGMHRILTLAPLSPAAKSLGETAVAQAG